MSNPAATPDGALAWPSPKRTSKIATSPGPCAFWAAQKPSGGRRDLLEAHDVILKGFKAGVLDHLRKQFVVLDASGNLEKALGVSLRTMQRRRKSPNSRLTAEQSGRAWKFAEILARVTRMLGSQEEAEAWLERPAMALDRERPIDLLSTTAGVEALEQYLTRVEYGVYT